MAQRMVHQHDGQHGLGDRGGADADAGIVAAVVATTTGLPALSIERRSRRMLDVGLIAMLARTSCPVEMPPSTPPAWLDRKPSGAHLVGVLGAALRDAAKPAPISTPLTALMPIIA
jgi:hypothetical protein